MKSKISIITPAYNCQDSIIETLSSVENQTYNEWYHIIVDDGSTDNSYSVIEKFISNSKHKSKYKLVSQSNCDQLNAIITGKKYIKGDYVFILHSDDILGSNETLEYCIEAMTKNPNFDALISNLGIMDKNSIVTGEQIVRNYNVSDIEVANQLLNLGRNQYIDVAFYKKDVFNNQVYKNYLLWNTPFWLDLTSQPKQLNVLNIPKKLINYRVFEGNYINSTIGLFNVTNGEIRTAVKLMNFYHIPLYSFQNLLSRIFAKLKLSYFPIFKYKRKPTSNSYRLIKRIIEIRYKNTEKNIYLDSLLLFYKNSNQERTISISKIDNSLELYYGKDVRLFANHMVNKSLHDFYYLLFREMKQGFSKVICKPGDKVILEEIFMFLNIINIKIVEEV